MQSVNGHTNSATGGLVGNSVMGDREVVPRTQLKLFDSEQNIQFQGLSLSLGTQMASAISMPTFQYQYPHPGISSFLANCLPIPEKGTESHVSSKVDESHETNLHKELKLRSDECMPSGISGGYHHTMRTYAFCNPHSPVCPTEVHSDLCLHGSPDFGNTILNSKYLNAAQLLLDEMVNARNDLKQTGSGKHKNFGEIDVDSFNDPEGKSNSQSLQMPLDPITNSSCELSPAEQQDLLDKKTKLLSMLDEIDDTGSIASRCKWWCHLLTWLLGVVQLNHTLHLLCKQYLVSSAVCVMLSVTRFK